MGASWSENPRSEVAPHSRVRLRRLLPPGVLPRSQLSGWIADGGLPGPSPSHAPVARPLATE
jgi:hypothetical protein